MSITAQDWLAQSEVDPAVHDRWPDYAVILVAVDHVDLTGLAPHAEALLAQAEQAVRAREPDAPEPHVARWHRAYHDFGVKPRVARVSVDALVRRATGSGGLPRINVLVDLYNAVSILHRVPIGGEDLGRYDGAARLLLATGHETFHTVAHGEDVVEHPEPGEPIWTDRAGVTCRRWNWRQTTRTAIQPGTTRVGFIIDSLEGPDHLAATRAAEQLMQLLASARTRTIRRDR